MTARSGVDTEALLLRSVSYRDADRIVDLFTVELGKVSAVARGARASRRRFGGTLEPFVQFRARLASTRSGLYTLTATDPVCAFRHIVADLDRVQAAAAGLALLREAVPTEQPEPALFAGALRWLTWLDHREDARRAALLAYFANTLGVLGCAPRLDACGRCGRRAPEGRPTTFDPGLGALACRQCGGAAHRLSWEAREWLARASADWLPCAQAPLPDEDLGKARAAMVAFVGHQYRPELASRLLPAS